VTVPLIPESSQVLHWASGVSFGGSANRKYEVMAPNFIRHRIRQKVQEGSLPRCHPCQKTMAKAQLMMEFYPQTYDRKPVCLHSGCYTLWNGERALEP
jgi:hypothetical protein